ncbi:hypothetical protein BO83DRAFT_118952 [Aspergillus eucalypticola CBS 122712]|uniref:Heterokaryon incompatibility domain-containing protein n=1 Tax=Aspergillus eucalypticola (strain CBS 122712 / IBT 29274) TaxID=1448314 RepID=A0A317UZN8_ASPEC|nr:uncharacterized protein BO83DRAFT_118952 [Aspergillus eucalypticola CBS 122712]PWY65400.1 hypothetical protein BO83DRAFT_118952 [Aspergillus eucalypticola CBS 122712]
MNYEYDLLSFGGPCARLLVDYDGNAPSCRLGLMTARLYHMKPCLIRGVTHISNVVCINQNNTAERGHQAQMKKIYSCAERVILWFGSGTNETNIILDSLFELEKKIRQYPSSRNWKLTDQRWGDLWVSVKDARRPRYPGLVEKQKIGIKVLYDQPGFQ